jgi:AraC-like DNA-binding protein
LLDNEEVYFCKLLFFSQKKVEEFLKNHNLTNFNTKPATKKEAPFFIIQNDDYIHAFVNSLSSILKLNRASTKNLLALKFEEIMLYLLSKYGDTFTEYLHSLIVTKNNSSFKKIIEANAYSNLNLEEISFLCNMSLSTFKRHFKVEYNQTPAKWMQKKRLKRARKLLQTKENKPSDIYIDLGYNNLSNFSIAFKNEFGINPKDVV